jgi:hypothetical protein
LAEHIIGKQLLDIKQKRAKNLNFDKVSTIYNMQVIPLLEALFDDLSPDSTVLRINKLEIDTGDISEKDFESKFPELVRKAIHEKIEKLSFDIPNSENQLKKISQDQSKLEILFYFLETGALPWWVTADNAEINSILRETAANYPGEIRNFLYVKIMSESIIKRLVFQFDNELIKEVIAILLKDNIESVNKLINKISIDWNTDAGQLKDNLKIEKEIFLKIFSAIKNTSIEEESITHAVYERLPDFYKSETEQKREGLPEDIMKSDIIDAPKNIMDKYNISNSGLVLLSPYLLNFFRNVNLIEDNDFNNYESRVRAVHFLQFIVSSKSECFEHLLTLNKILCGIDVSYPIEKEVKLNDFEKTEADELALSIIRNWPAIKNTSLNGFKDAFLKRDGILVQEENKWTLKIERKNYDILLERIPWNFSVIKLPWMKKILYVEW